MLEEEVQQAKRYLNFRRFMMNCLLFPERLHVSNRTLWQGIEMRCLSLRTHLFQYYQNQGGPLRFDSVTVRAWDCSSGSGLSGVIRANRKFE